MTVFTLVNQSALVYFSTCYISFDSEIIASKANQAASRLRYV